MRILYFLTISLLSFTGVFAQIQPEFRIENEDFTPLQNAVILTAPQQPGDFWDDTCYEVTLSQPVNLGVFNQTLSIMEICTYGVITFYNASKTNFYTVRPFQAEYIDKRIDESLLEASDILYKTEGGYTTVEFRNVASRVEFGWFGSVNSSFTFQMRIEHATGNVKFTYGESVYEQALWDIVLNTNEIALGGISVKVGNSHWAWILSGSRTNVGVVYVPVFTGNNFPSNRLREIPVEDTALQFIWETGASLRPEINQIDGKLYPNPSTGLLQLEFDGTKADLSIFDIWGRPVFQTSNVESGNTFQLNQLPSGIYQVRLLTSEGILQRAWKKI